MYRMSRPELVAIALVFGVCGRADCRQGTCQTLQPYFQCEFDSSGAAGGGNTIAIAKGPPQDIVVRISLEFPSHRDNGSDPTFFLAADVLTAVESLRPEKEEDVFVLQALQFGLQAAMLKQRPVRRWISRHAHTMEHRWREEATWNVRLAFGVATFGAECEFCIRMSVPLFRIRGGSLFQVAQFSETYTAHVAIMQKVAPVNLQVLTLQELLFFLVGYVTDLSAFAQANLWHDCHIGNLLMHTRPSQDEPMFYWHDFGGASSRTHSPRPQVLRAFVEKMQATISEIEKAVHARIPGFPSMPEFVWNGKDTGFVQMHLRSYTVEVQNHVMRWSGHEKLRQSVLLSLYEVLPKLRYDELQLLLVEGGSSENVLDIYSSSF